MGINLWGLVIILVLVALTVAFLYKVSATKRPCPHCRTMMPRSTTTCPHCRRAIPLTY